MGFAAPVSLPTIDASDFAGRRVPSRQWFVFELNHSRAVTMLAGDGGVGKSLLALQLAVAGLTGAQWLGMNAQRGPILYLSAEDEEDEIHRRLDRIITAQGCSYSDLKGLTFATLAGKDAILGAPNAKGVFEATSLFTKLRAQLAEIRPCLLVIDNLADVFGGDEIKKVQVRQFINMLSGLAIEFNMTVLLLSHPSQSGMTSGKGTSGNVAWNNSVRSRLYLTASDNKENKDVADIRELTVMKANYAAKGGKLMLRYESGAFAVVTKNDKKEANDKADAIFIQLLAQCSCENAIVTTGNKSTYYAPKILARMNGRGPFSFAKGRDRGSACADGMRWPNRLGRSRQSMGWRGAAKA
jgi:RecA-family ATPase